jgi:hypothetical protein
MIKSNMMNILVPAGLILIVEYSDVLSFIYQNIGYAPEFN